MLNYLHITIIEVLANLVLWKVIRTKQLALRVPSTQRSKPPAYAALNQVCTKDANLMETVHVFHVHNHNTALVAQHVSVTVTEWVA